MYIKIVYSIASLPRKDFISSPYNTEERTGEFQIRLPRIELSIKIHKALSWFKADERRNQVHSNSIHYLQCLDYNFQIISVTHPAI